MTDHTTRACSIKKASRYLSSCYSQDWLLIFSNVNCIQTLGLSNVFVLFFRWWKEVKALWNPSSTVSEYWNIVPLCFQFIYVNNVFLCDHFIYANMAQFAAFVSQPLRGRCHWGLASDIPHKKWGLRFTRYTSIKADETQKLQKSLKVVLRVDSW